MYRKVVTMTAWRRPEYTKRVIDAFKKCIGFEEYTILPTIEPGYPEVLRAFDGLSNCNIIVNNTRIGCGQNTLKSLQRGFDVSDFVIHIEDDTVPGIDSLKYFEWIYKTYKDDKEIFTATAYNRMYGMADLNNQNYFTVYRQHWFVPWMWCTWIDRFEEMIKGWDVNAWDSNITYKLLKNRYEIIPRLARSQNIGENLGINASPDFWRNNHYNPVWVNSVQNISFEKLKYTELSIIDEIKDFVTEGYRNILKREPDPEGLELHTGLISSGRLTKEQFLDALWTSEEYKIFGRI